MNLELAGDFVQQGNVVKFSDIIEEPSTIKDAKYFNRGGAGNRGEWLRKMLNEERRILNNEFISNVLSSVPQEI